MNYVRRKWGEQIGEVGLAGNWLPFFDQKYSIVDTPGELSLS